MDKQRWGRVSASNCVAGKFLLLFQVRLLLCDPARSREKSSISSWIIVSRSCWTRSLDGDELGTSGGTDTDLTVTNRLVSHGEITEIFTNHVCLDFDGVPVLAGVDFADRSDHLGHDDSVTEMGLDRLGLLTIWRFLDGLGQLFNETVVTRVDSTSESPALSSLEHSDNFLGAKLEELVKFDTSVNLLFEWFSFGSLRGLGSGKFFLDCGHI